MSAEASPDLPPGSPARASGDGPDTVSGRLRDGSGWQDPGGYSRAVRRGAHIAVSGTTANAPDGTALHPGDVHAQTRHALQTALDAVEALGGTRADVLRTRVMLVPGADWRAATRAHGEIFADLPPANSTYIVAGLVGDGFLVEVEVDAVVVDER